MSHTKHRVRAKGFTKAIEPEFQAPTKVTFLLHAHAFVGREPSCRDSCAPQVPLTAQRFLLRHRARISLISNLFSTLSKLMACTQPIHTSNHLPWSCTRVAAPLFASNSGIGYNLVLTPALRLSRRDGIAKAHPLDDSRRMTLSALGCCLNRILPCNGRFAFGRLGLLTISTASQVVKSLQM